MLAWLEQVTQTLLPHARTRARHTELPTQRRQRRQRRRHSGTAAQRHSGTAAALEPAVGSEPGDGRRAKHSAISIRSPTSEAPTRPAAHHASSAMVAGMRSRRWPRWSTRARRVETAAQRLSCCISSGKRHHLTQFARLVGSRRAWTRRGRELGAVRRPSPRPVLSDSSSHPTSRPDMLRCSPSTQAPRPSGTRSCGLGWC